MAIKQNGDTSGAPSVKVNAQTSAYTLAVGDAGNIVEMGASSSNNVTVPANSSVVLPVGTEIEIIQTSSSQCTVVADTGVTINATPGLKLRTQWSAAVLRKRDTDTWVLNGDLSA